MEEQDRFNDEVEYVLCGLVQKESSVSMEALWAMQELSSYPEYALEWTVSI